MHARALDRWRQNMRCRDRSHAFPRQMVASAHGYWNSDALLDVLDHIAQQHRCEFVPEATLKIEWKYTFHWVLGRRQWNRNPTHPLTTPKQQTCQWEGRWMLFSIGPSVLIGLCSLYRVETSAPGLSGYYWYTGFCEFLGGAEFVMYLFQIFLGLSSFAWSNLNQWSSHGLDLPGTKDQTHQLPSEGFQKYQ